MLARQTISIGGLNYNYLEPREIFAAAFLHSASGIVLVHNHPSGDPQPSDDDELLDDEGTQYGIATEENALIQPLRHMLSVSAGWAFNKWRSDFIFNAGGARYSYVFGRKIFMNSPRTQDALVFEAGMFVYKPIFNEGSYTVMPFTGSVRYDIQSRGGFTLYFYLGETLNAVIPGPNASVVKYNDLIGLMPAGGLGFLFPFGPNWNVRANFGVDSVDVGLSLRL